MKILHITVVVLLVLLIIPIAWAVDFTSSTCNGNQICESKTTCDFSGCRTVTSNCKACDTNKIFCPDGSVASCNSICQSAQGGAQCSSCNPQCPAAPDNVLVLLFDVYQKKGIEFNITPLKQKAFAGTTVEFAGSIVNKNPIKITIALQMEKPRGWTNSELQQFTLEPGQSVPIQFTVTSNISSGGGAYPLLLGAFSPEVGVTVVRLEYEITQHQPLTLDVTPEVINGVRGVKGQYNITIINNDPSNFEPGIAEINLATPAGWEFIQMPALRLGPGESSSVIFEITPNSTANDQNIIEISAVLFGIFDSKIVRFDISTCGDGICQDNENSCTSDCPVERFFQCPSGGCDFQVDDGVDYRTSVQGFTPTKFVVCSNTAVPEECETGFGDRGENCGSTAPCICGSRLGTSCGIKCVDFNSAYYLLAKEASGNIITSAKYQYSCPNVNLAEIIQIRSNFTNAKNDFEQSKSVLTENIAQATTPEERAKFQPCKDGLTDMIDKISRHIAFLDEVIAHPAVSNTTVARSRTRELRAFLMDTYNKFCRSAIGLLKFSSITRLEKAEIGSIIATGAEVENIGNILYYGIVDCTYTNPRGDNIVINSTCAPVAPKSRSLFSLNTNASMEGQWSRQCTVYGSTSRACSRDVHDVSNATSFSVFSKDTFVSTLSASCSSTNVFCNVTTNMQNDGVGCRVGNTNCNFIGSAGAVSKFTCPRTGTGFFNATGFVFETINTRPVEPTQQSASFRCTGLGDGIVDENEQCEPINTFNNSFCVQTTFECSGSRFGERPEKSFCGSNAQCIPTPYAYRCDNTRCGAQCSDGQTRNVTISNEFGSCVCTQQCDGSSCGYSTCSCAIPPQQLRFITPEDSATIMNMINVAVFATREENVSFGYDKISPTCSGFYGTKLNETTDDRFETNLNTSILENANYYFCAKTRTGFASIRVKINNNQPGDNITNITGGVGAQQCTIQQKQASCSYNPTTRNFDIVVIASWKGGAYSHADIENDLGRRYNASNPEYSRTYSVTGEGTKTIRLKVFDANGATLCSNITVINCLQGGAGDMVTLSRRIKDVVKKGKVPMELRLLSSTDINVVLIDRVQRGLNIESYTAAGNATPISMSTLSDETIRGKSFSVYRWPIQLRSSAPITINYITEISAEGSYEFASTLKYSDVEKNETKTINVSECEFPDAVTMRNPDTGECKTFENSCSLTAGFSERVTTCETPPEERPPQESPVPVILMIIILVVIAIIAVVLYKYRYEIAEKLEEIRSSREEI